MAVDHGISIRLSLLVSCALWATLTVDAAVSAATLEVGPGRPFKTVAAAVAAAADGDTIAVAKGTYTNDFAEVSKKITIEGVGGFAHLQATELIPNRKAILITDTDVTIRHIWFSGARVSAADGGNGAGVRYQGGRLVLDECYFTDNQNGILGVGDGKGTVTIRSSEFYRNGARTGPSAGYTHNLYLGGLARLIVDNSYFHGANVGHELKSRAVATIIRNSRFVDGPTGTASYSIDLPNGGDATITNTQIEQGPASQNPIIVSYGEEGNLPQASRLLIQGSLIENDLQAPSARGIVNAAGKPLAIRDTRIYGLTPRTLVDGPATRSGLSFLTVEPPISRKHPWEK